MLPKDKLKSFRSQADGSHSQVLTVKLLDYTITQSFNVALKIVSLIRFQISTKINYNVGTKESNFETVHRDLPVDVCVLRVYYGKTEC